MHSVYVYIDKFKNKESVRKGKCKNKESVRIRKV